MARLVLLSEGFTGRAYDLKVEKTTVGRVSDNAFEIADSSVSSHHAEILLKGNEILIRDLGSTNGTFINGERITETVLKPGQILRLGMIEMRLEAGESVPRKAELDQTRVIPQGVKLDELVSDRAPPDLNRPDFPKKSNRATTIFIIGVAVVGMIVIALLFLLIFKPS